MITLRWNAAPCRRYGLLPSVGDPYHFGPYAAVPVPGFLVSPDKLGPYLSEQIPFGFLRYPSSKRWGIKRDREVYHLSAHGVIDLSATALAFKFANEKFGLPLLGQNVSVHGNAVNFSSHVAWGQDISQSLACKEPGIFEAGLGVSDDIPFSYMQGIQFVGDNAFAYLLRGPVTIRWGMAYRTVDSLTLGWWIRRTKNQDGSWSLLYCSADARGNSTFDTPIGVRGFDDMAEALLTTSDLPRIPIQLWDWDQDIDKPLEAQDLSRYVFRIRSDLESSSLYERVVSVFTNHPLDIDWAPLTHQILQQHKYVDNSMFVDITQIVSGGSQGVVPWHDYVKVLVNTRTLVRAEKLRIRNFRSLNAYAKRLGRSATSSYLGTDYGVVPVVGDIQSMYKGVKKLAASDGIKHRYHARQHTSEAVSEYSSIESDFVLTTEVDNLPRDFLTNAKDGILSSQSNVRTMHEVGLWPDFGALWDDIPYSFVVDWFVRFQSDFDKMDDIMWSRYYPVQYVIQGSKRTWSMPLTEFWPELGLRSTIQFSLYQRAIDPELPLPTKIVGDEKLGSFHQWAEAGALVFQRVR